MTNILAKLFRRQKKDSESFSEVLYPGDSITIMNKKDVNIQVGIQIITLGEITDLKPTKKE